MYTKIDKDRIKELFKNGYSISEIAQELELTEKQVYNACHRMRKDGEYIPDLRNKNTGAKYRKVERRPRRKRGYLEALTVRLDPYILREIKDAAKRLNISQAVLIERAVIKYLDLKG